jgi:hypothetical protein
MSRGAFPITVVSNTNTAAVVQMEITEPLFLSPFLHAAGLEDGFYGVQTLDFNFSLGDLSRLWSHASTGLTFTAAPTVSFYSAPQLLFNYITPQDIPPMPSASIYSYKVIDRFPTNYGNINAGASTTISSTNIQLNSIPEVVWIFARGTNSSRSYLTSDAFLKINSISLNFQNQSGLLSSASAQDLYRMSCDNGLEMSWPQYSKFTGSVLCLRFGKDIGLDPLTAPGCTGTFQFQCNVNVTNVSGATINTDLYIVPMSAGSFTIEQNRSIAQIGILSKRDVLDAQSSQLVEYNSISQHAWGGGIFDSIKSFFKSAAGKVGDVARRVGSVAPGALEKARMLGQVARQAGFKVPTNPLGIGLKRRRRRLHGRGLDTGSFRQGMGLGGQECDECEAQEQDSQESEEEELSDQQAECEAQGSDEEETRGAGRDARLGHGTARIIVK